MDWVHRMNDALQYVEDNLLDNPNPEEAAYIANSSTYHFQRAFFILSNITFGEYIRNRRLSLAANEIMMSNQKIIDISLKYGYESPEAFTRAFSRMHGVSPREARKGEYKFKSFAPIHFTLSVKGATSMDYRIKTMDLFKMGGKSIEKKYGNVKKEVPAFWEKCYQDGTVNKIFYIAKKNRTGKLKGAILAAVWHNENNVKYLIGTETTEDVIGLETITIPALTWAIFEARGPMPDSVQDLWYRIFSEWFPSSGYEHVKAPGLEVTPLKIALEEEKNDEQSCEIWVPVVKKIITEE